MKKERTLSTERRNGITRCRRRAAPPLPRLDDASDDADTASEVEPMDDEDDAAARDADAADDGASRQG